MAERLRYSEFKNQFLIQAALASKGDVDHELTPENILARIHDSYQPSWARSVEKELRDEGMIGGSQYIGGSVIRITGRGLERAEELADELAFDLWEEIEADRTEAVVEVQHKSPGAGTSIKLETAGPNLPSDRGVLVLSQFSDQVRQLDHDIREVVTKVRQNNELVVAAGPEGSQRLAELDAARAVLKADQADRGLVERLLLPALRYLAKKVVDETTSILIAALIAAVIAFLA